MKTTRQLKKIFYGLVLGATISQSVNAQFQVSGQYMARGEYRHGYQTLADTNQKGAVFISQRARLSADYKHEKFKIHISAQDIRTWGSVANSAIDTKGFFSIYEAFGELNFTKKLAAKIGRQAISYDDDRIFGSLDWAMQGRRHDAAVLKYTDSTWAIHVGAAYNQNTESNKFIQYTVNNYKEFEYLWATKAYKKFNFSFLFLNNGMAYTKVNPTTLKRDSITAYSQTTGLRVEYKGAKLNGLLYGYYQSGKDNANKDLSAFDACAEIGYKPFKSLQLTLGAELLSGTSQTDTANKVNHSFNPLYGTNHRFNGYMDYFYVGNHLNTVGLLDGYFRIHYTNKKVLVGINGHYFNSASDIRDKRKGVTDKLSNTNLGGEVDFTMSYNYTDGVSIQAGYSQFFGTNGLQMLRGTSSLAPISNWAYVMVIIRPGTVKWPKTGLKM
ncbi:MAG: hypothetical protein IPJ32_00765 [Sphingobacteriaceae bacterium]|nr:hypothetical protein [Sphingobacteriaceae bacterium]MBP8032970.1 hypothetical protein [Bacteroidia bacterium]